MRKRVHDEYEYFVMEENNPNDEIEKKRRVHESSQDWKDDNDEIENGEIIEIDIDDDDDNQSIIDIMDSSDEELDDKETHSTPEEEEPNYQSDNKESQMGQSHLPFDVEDPTTITNTSYSHLDKDESRKDFQIQQQQDTTKNDASCDNKIYMKSLFFDSSNESDNSETQIAQEEQTTITEPTFNSYQQCHETTQISDEESTDVEVTDYDLAFCCAVCTCPKDHKYYSVRTTRNTCQIYASSELLLIPQLCTNTFHFLLPY